MPPAFQQGAERSDVVRTYLTAAANDAGAGVQPLGREGCVLDRSEVLSCFEHIDDATGFLRTNGGEAIGKATKGKARATQCGKCLRDRFGLGAVNHDRERFEIIDGIECLSE